MISNRYDFVLFYDVENGNPNGDPDAGNMPRLDPETMHGLVSDGALKRKIRDYVYTRYSEEPGIDIFVKHGGILNNEIDRAYEGVSVAKKDGKATPTADQRQTARDFMCRTYFDVRTFGAVMSTGANAGQVRGPVQLTFSRSIDPIVPLEISLTRVAFTDPKKAESTQSETEMGRKHLVPYALYRAHGFVSPQLAKQTGFSEDDLAKLWTALENMFELDRSAARGTMSSRLLCIFRHESPYGDAPAHRLFDAISVRRRPNGGTGPARSFGDYEIQIDRSKIPDQVNLETRPELAGVS
jgi:CRISPR-associated protein Csd2